MPSAWIDLLVAARLGLREAGRRLRGAREPGPDLPRFRELLDHALAGLPPGLVAEQVWIELPASEPPWRDSGIALRAGDEITYFAAGRVVVSAALDIWVTPKTQLWTRIGEAGPIRSSSRDSNTLRARSDGRLFFGNYFPNDWKDASGARLQDDAVYAGMAGAIWILVVRWRGSAREGLAALAATGDPLGVVSGERERLALGDPAPSGWRHLWHLGDTEIFHERPGPASERTLTAEVVGDAGILQRDAAFVLRPDTEIAWRWRVDALPGLLREDSIPSHDYLSLAVEFANGLDLTYYWSRELPVGSAYWCPLPNWKHREFHIVIRSGSEGLGVWNAERRNLHDDALRSFGSHPGDVVRVWLIAVSVFKRQRGAFSIAEIRLRGGGEEQVVLG
jgi:hypothetical protein